MAVILFGGFTAIGTAYGLSSTPSAARLPIFVLALPLVAMFMFSESPQLIGAALSLAGVAVLILRLLSLQNKQFAELIFSRATLTHEQELAEAARRQAVTASITDELTGLPNRRAFLARLDETAIEGRPFAVGLFDLDDFKRVNDTLGHAGGDAFLETVAAKLRKAAGTSMMVARLGGDEFGFIFPNIARHTEAKAIGARILKQLESPARIGSRNVPIVASMGVAIPRKTQSQSVSIVLAEADLALYEAKKLQGLQVTVFEPGMEAPNRRRAQIESSLLLPNTLERVQPAFQPIFDLHSGQVTAVEALARWEDPQLGTISPAEFVPIAEQLNLIGGISRHLMKLAISEASQWPATVHLALNLSTVELGSPQSANMILLALKRSKMPACRLQVEVTETALLADFKQARINLAKLRAAGVTIVLDDFGAGYSSIGYLREMRFDQIKLDGALIQSARESADGERLLIAAVGLCQALGVDTVAEHIETEDQLKLVTRLGCTAGQGFWLQSPVTGDKVREFIRSRSAFRFDHDNPCVPNIAA